MTSPADLDVESDTSDKLLSRVSPTFQQAMTGTESRNPLPVIQVAKESAVDEHCDASPKKKP